MHAETVGLEGYKYMKERIITGFAGTVLLLVLLLLPPIALNIALSVICAMAIIELLVTTKIVQNRGVLIASVIFSACTPFFMLGTTRLPAFAILFAYAVSLVCLQIGSHQTLSVEHTSFAFLMSITFPLSFSCVAYLRNFSDRDGVFYVFLAVIIPWMSDIGAYFVGTFFGKHKLCPNISPKKTVEGLFGGFIISIISSIALALLYQNFWLKDAGTVNVWQITVLALICAPLSVLGDLFASVIKRQCHMKDFGNVMPGHGGIMDRFDSLMLVGPLLFILVHYIPLIY